MQAVPKELKVQQVFKDLLMENTEKVLLSVHQVPTRRLKRRTGERDGDMGRNLCEGDRK